MDMITDAPLHEAAAPPGELKQKLNLVETVAMSVGLMAPTTGMVFVTSFLASAAGYNVPLSLVVSTLAVMVIGFCFGRLGRRYAAPGSAYGLAKHALGTRWGLVAGFGLLFTYGLLVSALLAGTGAFFQVSIRQIFGIDISWGWFAGGAGIVALMLAIRDLRPSIRLTLVLETLSMALVLVVCAIIVGHSHLDVTTAIRPFILNQHGLPGIAHALVFGLTTFLGFEGSATLGEKSKDPKRMVPIAVVTSALVGGIFFVLVSYSQTVGFGLSPKDVADFAGQSTPLNTLAQRLVGPGASAAINVGAAISFFGCLLAALNASSLMLSALSRDGHLPVFLGSARPGTNVPWNAVILTAIAGTALTVFGWAMWGDPIQVLGNLSGLASFGAIVTYGIVCVACLKEYWREDIADLKRRWFAVLLPLAGLAALVWVLYGNIYPVPAAPISFFPYIAATFFAAMITFSELYRLVARRNAASVGSASTTIPTAITATDPITESSAK